MNGYDPDSPEYRRACYRAERRVRLKLGFYWHLAVFLGVNTLCAISYLLSSFMHNGQYPWLPWPVAGSSAILVGHYTAIFVLGEDFQQRFIATELHKKGLLNNPDITDTEYLTAYRQAERKMVASLSVYWHLLISLIINFLSLLTYVLTSLALRDWYYPWFIWVIVGSIALFFGHFMWVRIFWSDLRQRLLEKELKI